MKTNGFFILAALLVLGYLHLLTMYGQSIDFSVNQEDFLSRNIAYLRQQPSSSNNPHLLQQPNAQHHVRITAADAKRQLEQASKTVEPLVQLISGDPIPSWDDMKQLDFLESSGSSSTTTARSNRVLYVISPTHQRITQRVDLIRLQQTLTLASLQHHAAKLYWIIIEDADHCSQRVRQIAQDSGLSFAHKAMKQSESQNKNHHRGLWQRNLGLETVLEVGKEGVIYFADDDNAYDVQLFTELLYTKYTSIFAVGLSGGSAYERCHVNEETGKVDTILTTWVPRYRIPIQNKPGKYTNPKRKYGIDMAGFAFSTTALQIKKARFTPQSTAGMLETDFLSQLVNDVSELEPLAANCTRILAWHVKTTEPQYFNNPEKDEATFELLKGML